MLHDGELYHSDILFLSVSYVKKLNIPSGVVGACRLDLAYEHFKVLACFIIVLFFHVSVVGGKMGRSGGLGNMPKRVRVKMSRFCTGQNELTRNSLCPKLVIFINSYVMYDYSNQLTILFHY